MSEKAIKIVSIFNVILGLLLLIATSGFGRVVGVIAFLIGIYHLFFKERGSEKKDKNVKLVNDYSEVEENDIFRFKDDNPNTLRFKKERPDNFTRWHERGKSQEVAGTSYRQDVCKKFINGENRDVEVEYAPTEEHPEAIKVLGIWEDEQGQNRKHIGFIPEEIAEKIHNTYDNLPLKANLATIYKPTGNKNLGIKIFLLREKRPGKYKK